MYTLWSSSSTTGKGEVLGVVFGVVLGVAAHGLLFTVGGIGSMLAPTFGTWASALVVPSLPAETGMISVCMVSGISSSSCGDRGTAGTGTTRSVS